MARYNRKHGLRDHPLYGVWKNIKSRCNNPRVPSYRWYGARGISVCPEWQSSAESFILWALGAGWVPGLEIDRKNGDLGYGPGNCRCVTHKKNVENCRKSVGAVRHVKHKENGLPAGVIRRNGRFMARITVNYRVRHLGTFDTPQEAGEAYRCALPS